MCHPADLGPAYPVAVPVTLTLRRLGYRMAYRVLQVFWFVRRPPKEGVKCLVTCRDRVLLVRHTYGSRAWDVPGGAIKRGEPPLAAAHRDAQRAPSRNRMTRIVASRMSRSKSNERFFT